MGGCPRCNSLVASSVRWLTEGVILSGAAAVGMALVNDRDVDEVILKSMSQRAITAARIEPNGAVKDDV